MTIALIPQGGIVGDVALREAAAGEFRDIMSLVRRAIEATVKQPGNSDIYVSIEAFFPDRAIVRGDGRYVAYSYSISDNNQVMLGLPSEVTKDFVPVSIREAKEDGRLGLLGAAQGVFLEAKDDQGLKWRVKIVEAGLSGNLNYYPDAVLREATPLFNGARVFVKSDKEHLKGDGKSFAQLIGRISNSRFIEGKTKDGGEVHADLEVLASAGDVPAKMLEAFNRGMADMFGFSMDATGRVKVQGGKRVAKSITKVSSVDLIIEPGAGGQLINLIEAIDTNPEEQADMALRNRMIEAIKKANNGILPDALDVNNDDALDTAYREALTPNNPLAMSDVASTGAASGTVPVKANVTQDELDASIRMVEARADMRVTIAESTLPDKAKAKLRNQFDGLTQFAEAQVNDAIKAEMDYLASFNDSGRVRGVGDTSFIESGEDRADKVSDMLDAFFDKKHKDHRNVRSFKECYREITGDINVSGDLRHCDAARMREALGDSSVFREALDSSSFSNVLGDSITRAMMRDWNTQTQFDSWRMLVDVVPTSDFRTQERTRFGGYGDLPTIGENGNYNPLTSPTDEKATYAVSKKGGTETISLEMVKNDDVGVIRRIPQKLTRAAKRTLGKFALDFLRTNPVIYDGLAFFHATHGNLGTAALNAASLAAGRLAMIKQTELDSGDQLGIPPMHLWAPSDLEETAFDLFRRVTNNDTDFVETLNMQVHPVWYWTDADDWVITADMADIPIVEIGFLDGNEEPEIFVQDMPTQGSLFSNDQIKYKIRHIYGGNVMDYRGAYKGVVT